MNHAKLLTLLLAARRYDVVDWGSCQMNRQFEQPIVMGLVDKGIGWSSDLKHTKRLQNRILREQVTDIPKRTHNCYAYV
jgi:hypothetical protein